MRPSGEENAADSCDASWIRVYLRQFTARFFILIASVVPLLVPVVIPLPVVAVCPLASETRGNP